MKKKYRKAIYWAIIVLLMPIILPILLMGLIGIIAAFMCENALIPMVEYLKSNLRIYEYDPD